MTADTEQRAQTPDPVTPTIHNVLYGALSAALLDHDVHLEPEARRAIRDDLEAAIAPLIPSGEGGS